MKIEVQVEYIILYNFIKLLLDLADAATLLIFQSSVSLTNQA